MKDFERKTNEFISKYFFEYGISTRDAAEAWIQEQLDIELAGLPLQIYEYLREKIEEKAIEVGREENNRFFAEVDDHVEFYIKSPKSILDKMVRSYMKNLEKPRKHIYTPKNFLSTMEDIVRFRILCNYLDDIKVIRKILRSQWWAIGEPIKMIKSKEKSHYITAPADRESGHRAHHFIFYYEKGDFKLHFEVQIMTVLGLGWDKKDHPLFYEYWRNRGKKKPSPQENNDCIHMYAMSESLFVADVFFDELRKRILKSRRI